MFFEKLSQICNDNNVTITALLNKLGLSKSSQLKWKSGSIPNFDAVQKIAGYFGVPTDYFADNKKAPAIEAEGKEFLKLMEKIKKMNPKAIEKLNGNVDDMLCNPANLAVAQRVKNAHR